MAVEFRPQRIWIAALVLFYAGVVMLVSPLLFLEPTFPAVAGAVVLLVALALTFSWYATVVITVDERALSRKAWGNTVTVRLRDIRASHVMYTRGRRSAIRITLTDGTGMTIAIGSLSTKDQEWLLKCPDLRVEAY